MKSKEGPYPASVPWLALLKMPKEHCPREIARLKQGQVLFKAQVEVTSSFSGDRPRVLEGIVGALGADRGRRLVRLGIYRATLQRQIFWMVDALGGSEFCWELP